MNNLNSVRTILKSFTNHKGLHSEVSLAKKAAFVLLLVVFLFKTNVGNGQEWLESVSKANPKNFYEIQKAFNDYWKDKTPQKGVGYKQFRRWEWYWEQRVDKAGNFPKNDCVIKEWESYSKSHREQLNDNSFSSANWTSLGPNITPGGYHGLGRVNCIAFHPTNINTFWIGTPSGGIWKTTNFGQTWTTNSDNLPVLGVTDIAVDYSNPNTLYIATGDGDGGSLSYCTNSPNGDTKSIGILKSTDGGNTWATTGMNWDVTNAKLIRRLIIHPSNPNILLAATTDGIYRTNNAGVSWTNQKPGYFMDIEFKPGNPNYVYAAFYDLVSGGAQIFRSTDGGINWISVISLSGVIRINLAVTANSPSLVEALCVNTDGGLKGLWRSNDSGASFSQYYSASNCSYNMLNAYFPPDNSCTGQGSYDLAYQINPNNLNEIWLGGVNTYKSINGGTNWYLINYWTENNFSVPVVHADKHFFAFHPLNPNYFFECNDGGLYYTSNGGTTWNDISNGLQISQIYRIGSSVTNPGYVICGMQDNGTRELFSGNWYEATGGDGMECAIDPTNYNYEYASYVNGEIYRTLTGSWSNSTIISNNLPGGQQIGAWVTPYMLDPNTPTIIYAGYSDVYKSMNQGTSWVKMSTNLTGGPGYPLRSLTIAPNNSQFVYTAKFSEIYKSTNAGSTWSIITSNLPTLYASITYIAVSPTDANTVYVSLSKYSGGNKVYKSTNGGGSWTNISGTLPNLPVNCIVYENNSNEGLYIGTDVGVYYKNATMSDWIYYNTGLPNVVVTELEIHYSTGKIRAATYGRGLWESNLYLSTYQITTSSNPVSGGTTSGGGSFTSGQQTTVIANSNTGYAFTNWTENGIVVSTNSSYTFTVTANRNLVANFSLSQFVITTSSNPTSGGTTFGGGTYPNGTSITVSANSNTGWNFLNWTENGNVVSTNSSYSFTVSTNRNLVANFSQTQSVINTSANPITGGTTYGGGSYPNGTAITVSANANTGWSFLNWTENGNVVSTNLNYTFTVTASRNLVANFSQSIYVITTSSNPGAGGNTNGGGNYPSGSSITVTTTQNTGWKFINWTENSMVVSSNLNYNFVVSSNRSLVANFENIIGVSELYSKKIKVYPNPSTGFITLEIEKTAHDSMKEIKILNFLGQTVWNKKSDKINPYEQIDLRNNPAGVYTLVTEGGNGDSFYYKIIIHK
jgi:photosystem II stability/assembly factor-like uncharacterized protein